MKLQEEWIPNEKPRELLKQENPDMEAEAHV